MSAGRSIIRYFPRASKRAPIPPSSTPLPPAPVPPSFPGPNNPPSNPPPCRAPPPTAPRGGVWAAAFIWFFWGFFRCWVWGIPTRKKKTGGKKPAHGICARGPRFKSRHRQSLGGRYLREVVRCGSISLYCPRLYKTWHATRELRERLAQIVYTFERLYKHVAQPTDRSVSGNAAQV